jgi:TusA-related sulfurtransferase
VETSDQRSRFLDISGEVCPLTFVRTRLALDELAPGAVLEVRLAEGEARDNVPRAAAELGHRVLGLEVEAGSGGRFYRLKIQKI